MMSLIESVMMTDALSRIKSLTRILLALVCFSSVTFVCWLSATWYRDIRNSATGVVLRRDCSEQWERSHWMHVVVDINVDYFQDDVNMFHALSTYIIIPHVFTQLCSKTCCHVNILFVWIIIIMNYVHSFKNRRKLVKMTINRLPSVCHCNYRVSLNRDYKRDLKWPLNNHSSSCVMANFE